MDGQTGEGAEGARGVNGEPAEGSALEALMRTMLEHQQEMEEKLWAYCAARYAPAAAGHMPAPAEGREPLPVCNNVASEVSFAPVHARAPTDPKDLSMRHRL